MTVLSVMEQVDKRLVLAVKHELITKEMLGETSVMENKGLYYSFAAEHKALGREIGVLRWVLRLK